MDRQAFEAAAETGLGSWSEGTVFLAAVSGGADSTAMLAALASLEGRRFALRCLHVEHGIRPAVESRGDADAVRELCAELGVPCAVVSIPPQRIARAAKRLGIGLEAAARLYRHRAWAAEARRVGAAKVLVAHTRDDLLETTLMRILRGSGPAGLAAMPRSRGLVLRPLLDRSRAEILSYLADRGLPYRIDSTNADPAFLRNRIRHTLIPCLDEFFPGWRKALLNLGETQRMAADFLEAEAVARIPWTKGSTPREQFFAQPPILREEALFAALDRAAAPGTKPPRRRSVRLFAQGKAKALDLGFAILRADDERVSVVSPPARPGNSQFPESGFSLLIKGPGKYKLQGLAIGVSAEGAPETAHPTERSGFFAAPLLVLRRCYPEDCILRGGLKRRGAECAKEAGVPASALITAEDARGTAAFIGQAGGRGGFIILLAREDGERQGGSLFVSIEH
jgi:tRNA(Ile)-lysidine synthase